MSEQVFRTSHVPAAEYAPKFVQGMLDRCAIGHARYGPVRQAFARGSDFLKAARERVKLYQEDGDLGWLVDAANFLMFEAMFPSVPDAEYRVRDEKASPGVPLEGSKRNFGDRKP